MTTQFQPPLPPDAEVPGAFEPAATCGPPPMSAAAVAGFVCSFVGICIPFVGPLLGLIFGIVGIARTSGARRRGRGLAIAALPIALLVGAGHLGLTLAAVQFRRSMKTFVPAVHAAFRASSTRVPEAAADLYQLSSKRFRVQVSEEQFQTWVAGVVEQYGQLQSAKRAPDPFERLGPGQFVIRHVARFVNGEALFEVVCGLNEKIEFEFDDIRIDGDSPLPD